MPVTPNYNVTLPQIHTTVTRAKNSVNICARCVKPVNQKL